MRCRVAKGCQWHGKPEGSIVHVSPMERRGWESVLVPLPEEAEADSHANVKGSKDRKASGTHKR